MIGFLTGVVAEVGDGLAILDVGGVGFEVFISAETASRLASMGSDGTVKMYTYTYVREDMLSLYGFLSRDELALFKQLITVSGIGPRGALSLLSSMSAGDLRFAILSGDSKTISRAPGIGKKTAERLILDLRDKLGSLDSEGAGFGGEAIPMQHGEEGAAAEAIEALQALGYPRVNAVQAVRSAKAALAVADGDAAPTTEDLLKAALPYLA